MVKNKSIKGINIVQSSESFYLSLRGQKLARQNETMRKRPVITKEEMFDYLEFLNDNSFVEEAKQVREFLSIYETNKNLPKNSHFAKRVLEIVKQDSGKSIIEKAKGIIANEEEFNNL